MAVNAAKTKPIMPEDLNSWSFKLWKICDLMLLWRLQNCMFWLLLQFLESLQVSEFFWLTATICFQDVIFFSIIIIIIIIITFIIIIIIIITCWVLIFHLMLTLNGMKNSKQTSAHIQSHTISNTLEIVRNMFFDTALSSIWMYLQS